VAGIDLGILVIYLTATTAIGVAASRRRRTSDDLMAARRAVPGWAVGLSIFGTYVSNISFLALPSKAYSSDWNAFAFSLAIPLSAWIAVNHFVPFYRASRSLSSYEHLEARFGPWARTYAVACYLLTQFARVGTIMFLLALALAPLTGWSVPVLILVSGSIVIAYTLYGGITAVIWTDVVQSVVFAVGAAACVVVILSGMPHGPAQAFDIARAHGKFGLGSFGPSLTASTFWVVLVYGFFIDLQNFGIDQNYVQRYQTAKSEADARRSVWLGALLYVPMSAMFFLIGTGLYAYYTARPDELPAATAETPDAVFPYFIAHQLPTGLVGLVVAALFAAAQSTIATSINSSATLLLCDVYQRYVQPNPSERRKLAVLRAATVLVGAIGTAAALAMMRVRSALDAWWLLAGVFSGGMLGLFLLGRLSRRATSRHALAAVAAGIVVIVWMTFWGPFHSNLIIVFGTLTVLALGLLAGARSAPDASGSR
jgi:SSS family solute:Na+ symporter